MRIALWTISFLLLLSSTEIYGQKPQDSAIDAQVVTIGNIYVTGNDRTREEIVRRELDFKEGDVFKKADLLQTLNLDKQKLMNTRLFNTVELVPLQLSDTKMDVLIRLQERWYIFPIPIFKLADRNFTEWWVNQKRDFSRVNWGLQLYHMNVTGRNDRLDARLQFGFTQNVALRYTIPYIDKNQKLGLSAGVSYSTNKTISYTSSGHRQIFLESSDVIRRTFGTSSTLTYRPSFYSRHQFSLGYSQISVADTIPILNPDYLGNGQKLQRYFGISYGFSIDKRDFVSYPLQGSYMRIDVNQLGLGIFGDMNMLATRASYSKYFDLGKKFYQANRVEITKNFGNPIPYIQRTGFGYSPNFIRGYEKYVVESDLLLSYRSSIKFKFLDNSFSFNKNSVLPQFRTVPYSFLLKAFLDMGYSGDAFNNTENTFYNNQLIGSIGLGVDMVTYYDMVLRFEYSMNFQGNTGFYFSFGRAL